LKAEIESLLLKGAISPQVYSPERFYSSLFLVPKKNGQMRPVVTQWGGDTHFKMEGISTLQDLLRMGD